MFDTCSFAKDIKISFVSNRLFVFLHLLMYRFNIAVTAGSMVSACLLPFAVIVGLNPVGTWMLCLKSVVFCRVDVSAFG